MAAYKDAKKRILENPEKRKLLNRYLAISRTGGMVYQWRKSAGLSQAKLADAIGSTQESISRIENGKTEEGPKLTTLAAIAHACGRQLTLTSNVSDEKTVAQAAAWNVVAPDDADTAFSGLENNALQSDDALAALTQQPAKY